VREKATPRIEVCPRAESPVSSWAYAELTAPIWHRRIGGAELSQSVNKKLRYSLETGRQLFRRMGHSLTDGGLGAANVTWAHTSLCRVRQRDRQTDNLQPYCTRSNRYYDVK